MQGRKGEKEVVARKIIIARARSRVRAPLGTSPSVSVTSVKAVRRWMPTSILGRIATLDMRVSMLVSWNLIVQCMHLWIVLISLQKYSRKKSYILEKKTHRMIIHRKAVFRYHLKTHRIRRRAVKTHQNFKHNLT